MAIGVFLSNQKVQRVDTGVIAPAPPPSLASLEVTVPPTEPDEVDELEKQITKAKKVANLKRQLAEALEEPTPRSNWNLLSRN
jgi:hypothetical protein